MANRQTEESIEFPRTFSAAGNIVLATWIALDTVAFLVFNLVTGVVFLLTALMCEETT